MSRLSGTFLRKVKRFARAASLKWEVATTPFYYALVGMVADILGRSMYWRERYYAYLEDEWRAGRSSRISFVNFTERQVVRRLSKLTRFAATLFMLSIVYLALFPSLTAMYVSVFFAAYSITAAYREVTR